MTFTRQQLGQPAAMILDGMVWLESGRIPMPWHRSLVAYASGHLPRAGAFKGYVAKLKACELVSFPPGGGLVLEHEGRQLALQPNAPFARIDYWRLMDGHLGPGEREIAALVREVAPGHVVWTRDELRDLVPAEISEATFRQATAKLLSVHLLDLVDGLYCGTAVLYPRSVFEQRAARSAAGGT